MSRLRIVGGAWRSRRLPVAGVPGLRPTPDRVRETVFNWLGQTLDGWAVLDLFAGSGALGLEAASRGAGRVDLVERDRRAAQALCDSVAELDAANVEIHCGDALKFAASNGRRYDLVFLDPPYKLGLIDQVAAHLDSLVAEDGWLYVEAERPMEHVGSFKAVKRGRAGQVYYQLMRRSPP